MLILNLKLEALHFVQVIGSTLCSMSRLSIENDSVCCSRRVPIPKALDVDNESDSGSSPSANASWDGDVCSVAMAIGVGVGSISMESNLRRRESEEMEWRRFFEINDIKTSPLYSDNNVAETNKEMVVIQWG